MFPFIETIQIDNYRAELCELHLNRMVQTCMEVFGETRDNALLNQEILQLASEIEKKTKLSIHYNLTAHKFISSLYTPKKINQFRLVEKNDLDYHLKYADRSCFDTLKKQSGKDAEIIIVQNGRITDTSFSNICFLKDRKWFTPDTPLLRGIKRKFYLQTNRISEKEISVEDIPKYERICLINSMLNLRESEYDIDTIHPDIL